MDSSAGTSSIAKFFQPKDYSVIRAETLMIQFLIEPNVPVARKNITYGGSKYAKKIGSPLRGSWICDMCIDARKTSLTGVQNSKKNRLAATRLVDM